jgi:DNA topoisomerase I
VDLDWKKVYTATLQRKFRWVEEYDPEELKLFYPLQKQVGNEVMKVVVSEESTST